jgi:putative PIN family toxin of toxin-antitoxin system
MKVVVDSNIIFSALLTKNSKLRDTLLKKNHHFYSPNYFFNEIFKYKEKILSCSKLDEVELYEYLRKILENIQFISREVISKENRLMAFDLCKDIDEKDTPFIALAIEIDAYVWTGDKKLKKGLAEKGFSKFVDTGLLDNESTL